MVIVATAPRRVDGTPTNVTVRGVTPTAFAVRNEIKMVEGRNFKPGLYEVIVGQRIQGRVRGLELGSKFTVMKRNFEVVGVFTADGSSFESEVWGDSSVMGPAFNRAGGENSLTV